MRGCIPPASRDGRSWSPKPGGGYPGSYSCFHTLYTASPPVMDLGAQAGPLGTGGVSCVQGGPKPCDARRGDAAMLLIFPLTGVDFLSWSQISSPSWCLSVCNSCPGGCHPSGVPQPCGCGCWCWSLAQPRGWQWDRSHCFQASRLGLRCCYKPGDRAMPGEYPSGIGWASPNGCPGMPQGQRAASLLPWNPCTGSGL